MCLNAEACATATGCGGIRVLNQEARSFQTINIINYAANKVLQTHRVDNQGHVVFVDGGVTVIYFFIERETVLKTGAATTRNVNA